MLAEKLIRLEKRFCFSVGLIIKVHVIIMIMVMIMIMIIIMNMIIKASLNVLWMDQAWDFISKYMMRTDCFIANLYGGPILCR